MTPLNRRFLFSRFLKNISVLAINLTLLSCNVSPDHEPGICLSFDDQSVDEWFELRKLFNDNNVKATFFISEPATLTKSEIYKLKILEKDGHEIGFHGTMHVLSEHYIQKHSYKEYLEKEIDVGLKQVDSLGFKCLSFAYPYGAKYWFTDLLLLRKFEILRSVSPINKAKKLSLIDDIYYSFDGDNTVSAIGIDNNAGVNERMINEGMERAIKQNEVLMLYGHKPTNNNDLEGYYFSTEFLQNIISKANEKQLRFYTMNEL